MGIYLWNLFGVLLIDLVLSGDNALVIGMACAGLPPHLRRRGIIFGSLAAVLLRVLMATGAAYLLMIPLLQGLGGIMLLWIAYRLAVAPPADHHRTVPAATIWAVVRTIAVADLVMSLDNVLALGGISKGDISLLVVGLGLSIPIIMWGSGLVATLLNRLPWLTFVGAAVLTWTAGGMITADPKVPVPDGYLVSVIATALVMGAASFDRLRRPTFQ
jgi:YjbE family integral membrane protein